MISIFLPTLQNLISTIIVVLLGLSGTVSVEKLNWRLVRVWIPVNVIFIGMLVSGMYRYGTIAFYLYVYASLRTMVYGCLEPINETILNELALPYPFPT